MKSTIAILFDFDDTLAPDSTTAFLQAIGVDVHHFWKEEVQQLIDQGWDPIPAYLYCMLKVSKGHPIKRERMKEWAKSITFYPGVLDIFERLRRYVATINPLINLEFYIISSGIALILQESAIAHHFQDIWGSDFHFTADGVIAFPKRIVSFTDKTRYIFQVAKGLFGERYRSRPFDVNSKVDHLRVPINQMIFVGDGYTDIPCFSLIRKGGGIAIGVYDTNNRDKWGRAWGFIEQQRVSNLVPADYSEHSALSNSLIMAVESIARRIELSCTTYQG